MTADQLTASLAARVMHWRASPDRFLTGDRGWLPRWKFQPSKKMFDAVRLLEAANADEYSVAATADGTFSAKVRFAGVDSEARANTKPLAICLAIAAAVGIEVGP